MQIETFGADVRIEANAHVATIVLDRPARRNAIDRPTANALADAFERFETHPHRHADGSGPGPPGPTRMVLSRPTIAVITGYAVTGGPGATRFAAGAGRHGDPLDVRFGLKALV